tara:strand:+ start:2883 stop:4049 length:1167 start_codon:yes stop_codon:yes gene_type:complete
MKNNILIKNILNSVKLAVKHNSKKLHEPIFKGNEKRYLKKCIETGYVSYIGKYVNTFERKISKYTGSKNAVALVNGTCALHILLRYFNVGINDEVILPSITFVATANSIAYCKAFPHFVDIEKETLGICPKKLDEYLKKITIKKGEYCINKTTGRKIRVLIAVHAFGIPCKILEIKKICKKYNIKLIEDAAGAMGSFLKGRHLGNFSQAGVISFNGNKTITCGGGAVIITEDKKLASKIKHLSTTAKKKHPWEYIHDEIGYNYRMTNLNAAIGCAQLENINRIISAKRKNFILYKRLFKKNKNVEIIQEPNYSNTNYWLITLIIKKNRKLKNQVLKELNQSGFQSRSIWKPLHTLKIFEKCPKGKLKNTMEIYNRAINLPSSPILSYK